MPVNVTGVGWTDLTWNLWSGCKAISAGCKFCYAETLTEQRRGLPAAPYGFELTVRPKNLRDLPAALRRHGPSLIFCESMSDVGLDDSELSSPERERLRAAGFEDMDTLRDAFFDAIEATPEHRYQLVTKRPLRLLAYFVDRRRLVPASCWLGTTIEHASTMHRLETLRRFRGIGARVLWISAEPLLGDLVAAGLRLDGIDWLVAGGESGTHVSDRATAARFLVVRDRDLGWTPTFPSADRVRRLRDEAARASCAFFFKQWGGPRPDSAGRSLDGVEHDGLPTHISGAMPPGRRVTGAATGALARKRLPVVGAS